MFEILLSGGNKTGVPDWQTRPIVAPNIDQLTYIRGLKKINGRYYLYGNSGNTNGYVGISSNLIDWDDYVIPNCNGIMNIREGWDSWKLFCTSGVNSRFLVISDDYLTFKTFPFTPSSPRSPGEALPKGDGTWRLFGLHKEIYSVNEDTAAITQLPNDVPVSTNRFELINNGWKVFTWQGSYVSRYRYHMPNNLFTFEKDFRTLGIKGSQFGGLFVYDDKTIIADTVNNGSGDCFEFDEAYNAVNLGKPGIVTSWDSPLVRVRDHIVLTYSNKLSIRSPSGIWVQSESPANSQAYGYDENSFYLLSVTLAGDKHIHTLSF